MGTSAGSVLESYGFFARGRAAFLFVILVPPVADAVLFTRVPVLAAILLRPLARGAVVGSTGDSPGSDNGTALADAGSISSVSGGADGAPAWTGGGSAVGDA